MKILKIKFLTILISLLVFVPRVIFALPAQAGSELNLEKIFYFADYRKDGYDSIRNNIDKIDILAPQSYTVTSKYKVTGGLPDELKQIVSQNNLKVMPLVVNAGFNQALIHKVLVSTSWQDNIINFLVVEAKKENFIGWQFDFEHIKYTDKALYSKFVQRTAKALKKNHLIFSVATVVPSDEPDYKKSDAYKNWGGAFDYAAIGKAVDFISVMTYDDPLSGGPTAPIYYVKNSLALIVKNVPVNKISLGIPFYYWEWCLNNGKRIDAGGTFAELEKIRSQVSCQEGFDESFGVSWLSYSLNSKDYKVWFENAKSVSLKLDVIKENGLRGFSAWVLGSEDPNIWNLF